jgi:hypothetical protein
MGRDVGGSGWLRGRPSPRTSRPGGFSAFQFADDKVRALSEARRVARGSVVIVIPTRVAESGVTAAFKPLLPLFAANALRTLDAERVEDRDGVANTRR